jgi:hypothetical protein
MIDKLSLYATLDDTYNLCELAFARISVHSLWVTHLVCVRYAASMKYYSRGQSRALLKGEAIIGFFCCLEALLESALYISLEGNNHVWYLLSVHYYGNMPYL